MGVDTRRLGDLVEEEASLIDCPIFFRKIKSKVERTYLRREKKV